MAQCNNFLKEMHAYAESVGLVVMSSDVIPGRIVDISDPVKKVALNLVALDGSITHMSSRLIDMSVAAHDSGYTLYHVYESDWIHRKRILMKKVAAVFGVQSDGKKVYRANKCGIRKIDEESFRDFYKRNSMNVLCKSEEFYGLYPLDPNDKTMLAAVSTKKVKKDQAGVIMTSYTTSLDHKVIGSFGKFVRYLQAGRTYCIYHADIRWLDLRSDFVLKSGMNFVRFTDPLSFAYKRDEKKLHLMNGMTRESATGKFALLSSYDDAMTLEDNLTANEYHFVKDAGCMVFCTKK